MQNNTSYKPDLQEENLLSALLYKYLPYWPLFVLFLILSFGAAFCYLKLTNPKYEATASLIINDEKKGANESEITESLNLLNTKKIIENEVEVLKSRTLMDTVVKSLHLYAPIFRKESLKTTSAYHSSPVKVIAAEPDDLVKAEKISLEFITKKNSVLLAGTKAYPLDEWVNTSYGVLKFTAN